MALARDRADDRVPPAARAPLRALAVWIPWIPVAAATLAFAGGLSVPPTWRYAPLVVSVVAFGLPHGAVDWAALPRAATGRLAPRWLAVVGVVYLLGGGAYAVAWFTVPLAAAVAFLALTWFHWGQGEIHPLRELLDADHLDARWRRALTLAVRGALPMGVPLLAFPDRYRAVLTSFVAPFGGSVPAWPFTTDARLALGAALAALTLATLAVGYRAAGHRRGWAVDAGETLLLWAYFLVVPPVFAVGLYFCCWHAPRHVARVLTLDDRAVAALEGGRLAPALGRFAREAALPTLVALVGCGALWWAAPAPEPTLAGATGVYLVAIAVLTLPHVVVVTWLDRIAGYW
ncbi:Brp/Blh family beta-carotene 15,15'-dioxygenase [Halosimplex rubrum]|uniref:Probable beta-carotene 15,15'-dioxygenase n=1 Tax=Halosimplex rubrum TaxID=869889 RepID=A0A7D5TJN0_9EURY|nr:Brp/Blh family beta-carotene 15,15'-dioxygenase [Halosimplex rubrum]QLH76092.1 Brp/Blh family beta-carotene 15,15'-dioxygenase [Halosimplex rubrum]